MAKQESKTSITLDKSSLEKLVAEANKVRSQITEAAGTMGAIMGKASATVSAQPSPLVNITVKPGSTWEETFATLEGAKSELEEAFNKTVKEAAGAHIKKHRGNTDALKTRLEALVTQASAMHGLLSSMGVDVSGVEVPSAKVGKPSGGSTGSKKSSATVEYYKVEDGKTVVLASDHRAKLGSVAWYWFGQCGAGALKLAITASGATVGETFEPRPVTAGGKTLTLGCRPIEK